MEEITALLERIAQALEESNRRYAASVKTQDAWIETQKQWREENVRFEFDRQFRSMNLVLELAQKEHNAFIEHLKKQGVSEE